MKILLTVLVLNRNIDQKMKRNKTSRLRRTYLRQKKVKQTQKAFQEQEEIPQGLRSTIQK